MTHHHRTPRGGEDVAYQGRKNAGNTNGIWATCRHCGVKNNTAECRGPWDCYSCGKRNG